MTDARSASKVQNNFSQTALLRVSKRRTPQSVRRSRRSALRKVPAASRYRHGHHYSLNLDGDLDVTCARHLAKVVNCEFSVELRGFEPLPVPAKIGSELGRCSITVLRDRSVSCRYAPLCYAT